MLCHEKKMTIIVKSKIKKEKKTLMVLQCQCIKVITQKRFRKIKNG